MKFFISSTYEDLVEIRDVAIKIFNGIVGSAKNSTGEVVAMEFFCATERTCKEECLKELDKSDIVIGIYGNRYGSIDAESGLSMTEVEFEYAITEGDIDIDKIINKSKRTKILSIRLRKFEIIAPVLSDKYSEEYKSLKKVDCSANLEPSATYFAVYTDENERKCLLFDPSQKMLDITEKYCPDKFFRG